MVVVLSECSWAPHEVLWVVDGVLLAQNGLSKWYVILLRWSLRN